MPMGFGWPFEVRPSPSRNESAWCVDEMLVSFGHSARPADSQRARLERRRPGRSHGSLLRAVRTPTSGCCAGAVPRLSASRESVLPSSVMAGHVRNRAWGCRAGQFPDDNDGVNGSEPVCAAFGGAGRTGLAAGMIDVFQSVPGERRPGRIFNRWWARSVPSILRVAYCTTGAGGRWLSWHIEASK